MGNIGHAVLLTAHVINLVKKTGDQSIKALIEGTCPAMSKNEAYSIQGMLSGKNISALHMQWRS